MRILKFNMKKNNIKLAVIGLGYVGFPLAVEFSKKRPVIGFDIQKKRIEELKSGIDKTLEVKGDEIKNLKQLTLTDNKNDLQSVNCYIVTVPTPVDLYKKPDLKPLLKASEIIGKVLKYGDIVIYESTVYPGCTEEECVPILEKYSGLKFNQDFFCGYSPERNNPGDKLHKIYNIKKITSGSTVEIANFVDDLYSEIIVAGTYKAPSIKIAEAAKVIENTQRDLNIGFINELSIIFNKMNIDTEAVLEAAGSKWNFLPFRPGLVGGHCISVDPYYLIHKAESIGYQPEIILAVRKINNNMGIYVASQFMKAMNQKLIQIKNSKILIMGLTFKENCPDLRNSGIESVIKELKNHQCCVDLYDPWANRDEVKNIYNILPITSLNHNTYDGIIIAIAHEQFKAMEINFISALGKKVHVVYDMKSIFSKEDSDLRL
jgi:UDP-N-acetyl-D-glucosamine/UDP-N-acetyl-D-galactosamine dehydrogenase